MISQQFDLDFTATQAPGFPLSRGANELYGLIKRFLKRYGHFYASQLWIGSRLDRSIATIRRWTKELLRAGVLGMKRRARDTAIYTLGGPNMTAHFERSDERSDERSYPYNEPYNINNIPPPPTPSPNAAAAAASPSCAKGEGGDEPAPATGLGLSNSEFKLIQRRCLELGMSMPSRRLAARVRGKFPTLSIENVIPLLVRFDGQNSAGLWDSKAEDDFRAEQQKKPPMSAAWARENERLQRVADTTREVLGRLRNGTQAW